MERLEDKLAKKLEKKIEEIDLNEERNAFEFEGQSYWLFLSQYYEGEQTPTFYQVSRDKTWEIYFSADIIPENFRKVVLFHDVFDSFILRELLHQEGINIDQAKKRSHRKATCAEIKYAKKNMNTKEYTEYLSFRKKWRLD